MTTYTDCWIGFGSNLGDRRANLRHALDLLAQGSRVVAASPLYSTEPIGYLDQGWFLNGVAHLETPLSAEALLAELHSIEAQLSRERTMRNGPRTIDLDILLHGNSVIHLPGLTVPHPRAHERLFVIAPWADLAPDLILPAANRQTLAQLRLSLAGTAMVERYAEPPW